MKFISQTAQIMQNVTVGYYTVICDGAIIGSDVFIGNNVTIYPGTYI